MNAPILKAFRVTLHRRGGTTTGHIDVQARCEKHAERVAIDQTIAVSYPKSKPSRWVVDAVEART